MFIAYSSVTHINFNFLVLMFFVTISKRRSFLIIITHGVVASLIFWFLGLIYYKSATRRVYFLRGVQRGFYILNLLVFLANFRIPPFVRVFQEILFFSVIFSFNHFLLFYLGFYIIIIIYYNIYFRVSFSIKNKKKVVFSCRESIFLFVFIRFLCNYLYLQVVF